MTVEFFAGKCDNGASSIELKDIDATHHTKIVVSLLHDLQVNEQRATLLQLVDKFKAKWKGLGNRPVKLEIAVESSQDRGGGGKSSKGAKRSRMSDMEAKLDGLRRELSSFSSNGGINIFPPAVLSSEQILLLSCQKPTTEVERLEKVIGKVKKEKYSGRIIELMRSYVKDSRMQSWKCS
ncbi:unnamed protein product [Miscanthus lutarioriparius]|uniref:Uncharacterized protein n=1 Tax=Miscanthus lutarioriparius TaxID=422564 RepID=A0A811PH73_9POAL|nr:unnamed protein product [Miscanthus lutarioriparius]